MARAALKRHTEPLALAAADDASWLDGPIRDPRINDTVLPVSWADPRFVPKGAMRCGCCKGSVFWGDGSGWRCATCHPNLSNAPGIETVRLEESPA